jgi:glycosyltransferase involved in cell wall biosynthesis
VRQALDVVTNLQGLAAQASGTRVRVTVHPRARGRLHRLWIAAAALRHDYAVINCSAGELFDLCLAKMLLPFSRGRIVSMDTVLPVPSTATARDRLRLLVKRVLFRRVHLFIEYFKETSGYERHYGIPRARFRYVPFKINRHERVLATPTADEGYIFCGGNTRRDFRTLVEAVRSQPYPVRIVTMAESIISGHGSFLDEENLPRNVQVVRHDGSDSFLDHIARARLVVLPIRKDNISASGIGVYLAAMALGKCVVISAGPAVNGVVPDGAAIVVPPEDVGALRAAIAEAWSNHALRTATADAGRRYALALGGEERLCRSVLDVLLADADVTGNRRRSGREEFSRLTR